MGKASAICDKAQDPAPLQIKICDSQILESWNWQQYNLVKGKKTKSQGEIILHSKI